MHKGEKVNRCEKHVNFSKNLGIFSSHIAQMPSVCEWPLLGRYQCRLNMVMEPSKPGCASALGIIC